MKMPSANFNVTREETLSLVFENGPEDENEGDATDAHDNNNFGCD
jgi:hypothetical protein